MTDDQSLHDGYTQEATIPAGVHHTALTVTFRPMLTSERVRCSRAIQHAAHREIAWKLCSKALDRQIVSWSSERAKTAYEIGKLPEALLLKLFAIVSGDESREQEAADRKN